MELCDNGHEQVCYEGLDCPVCKCFSVMQGKADALQADNDRLTIEVDDLRSEIANVVPEPEGDVEAQEIEALMDILSPCLIRTPMAKDRYMLGDGFGTKTSQGLYRVLHGFFYGRREHKCEENNG